MPNGDMVNIIHVATDIMEINIPSDVIQDGPKANLEKFSTRIYFQKPLQVKVTYFSNSTGEQKYITLQNLKTVSTEHFLFNRLNGFNGFNWSIPVLSCKRRVFMYLSIYVYFSAFVT